MSRPALPRRARTLAAVAGLALLGNVVSSSPALAERWPAVDPTGDVRGVIVDVAEECVLPTPVDTSAIHGVDIEGMTVRHGPRRVVLTLAMDEVRRHEPVQVGLHLLAPGSAWAIDLDHYGPRDRWHVDLSVEPDWEVLAAEADPDGDGCGTFSYLTELLSCPGERHEADRALDRFRVSIPRTCLDSPRWVRAAADAWSWRESDSAYFDDRWAPEGEEPTTIVGPYGPRVHTVPGTVVEQPAASVRVATRRTEVRRLRLVGGEPVTAATHPS